MIKLVCFVRRKDGMSVEEFHRYWREEHGPLVASTRSGRHAVRYEQNHRLAADYARDGAGPAGYDGVTEQWFPSMDEFWASVREPDYADIAADVDRFIDTSSLVFVLTEEAEVIFDG